MNGCSPVCGNDDGRGLRRAFCRPVNERFEGHLVLRARDLNSFESDGHVGGKEKRGWSRCPTRAPYIVAG
jgi:hypothetical protein